MRALKTCLWIVGVCCCLSVFGLLLPLSVLETFAKVFGNEAFPDSPVFVYAVRIMSATYVAVGVFFIILAQHPMKYGVLVPFSGAAAVFIGVACGICGFVARMPLLWFLGDFLFCTAFGILILVFWRRTLTPSNEAKVQQPSP